MQYMYAVQSNSVFILQTTDGNECRNCLKHWLGPTLHPIVDASWDRSATCMHKRLLHINIRMWNFERLRIRLPSGLRNTNQSTIFGKLQKNLLSVTFKIWKSRSRGLHVNKLHHSSELLERFSGRSSSQGERPELERSRSTAVYTCGSWLYSIGCSSYSPFHLCKCLQIF